MLKGRFGFQSDNYTLFKVIYDTLKNEKHRIEQELKTIQKSTKILAEALYDPILLAHMSVLDIGKGLEWYGY